MPRLELVSCMGAGYETVDAAAARGARHRHDQRAWRQ